MLKAAVKGLAGSLGYDVIRRNGGGRAKLSRGIVSRFEAQGHDIAMLVLDEWDYIQAHHLRGTFYEPEELDLIARHFDGGVLVDVGANVGNHTVYALKVLGADKVIAFEPNPAAALILNANLALNGLTQRCEHRLAGLSDRAGAAQLVAPSHRDLGSTRLATAEHGAQAEQHKGGATCAILTGDDALAGEPSISMIKIDTEAMEVRVLAGLTRTIMRHRPKLFVEVDEANRETVLAIAAEHGYAVVARHKRYAENCNYLLAPAA